MWFLMSVCCSSSTVSPVALVGSLKFHLIELEFVVFVSCDVTDNEAGAISGPCAPFSMVSLQLHSLWASLNTRSLLNGSLNYYYYFLYLLREIQRMSSRLITYGRLGEFWIITEQRPSVTEDCYWFFTSEQLIIPEFENLTSVFACVSDEE